MEQVRSDQKNFSKELNKGQTFELYISGRKIKFLPDFLYMKLLSTGYFTYWNSSS